MGDHPHPSSNRRRVTVVLLMTLLSTFWGGASAGVSSPRLGDAPCPAWMRLDVPLLAPMLNGSAWDPENGMLWPREAYFEIEGETKAVPKEDPPEAYVVCPCNVAGPNTRPCLRKCCPLYQAMDRSTLGCVSHKVAEGWWFKPPVMHDVSGGEKSADHSEKPFFVFHGAEDECEKSGRILLKDEEFFLSSKDGSLVTHNGTKMDDPGSFCIDYFVGEDKYIPILCYEEETDAAAVDGETMDSMAVTEATNSTAERVLDTCEEAMYILYPMGMIISIIFLSISLFVHAYIRELRNLHGKCLMCHISSLLTAYVFLTIVQVFGKFLDDNACTAAGLIVYFSFLSTFLWLNIMCIDMFIAFSGMRSMAGSNQETENRKFTMYAVYSWGTPFIILMITCILEFGPVPDYILKPEFKVTCWFKSDSSRIAYFIAPVGLIIACNIVLFMLTARKIYRLKRDTKVLKKGDSRRHQTDGDDNNQRFMLYLKLFIVMGVNWALEIISWLVGGGCIWIPFDLLNTMQGVFVFYIFVWKVKIRRKLTKTLCPRLAAKLKFIVPTTTLNLDRGTSASTVSSNLVSSCADESKVRLDTVSSRVSETAPSGEVTTVT